MQEPSLDQQDERSLTEGKHAKFSWCYGKDQIFDIEFSITEISEGCWEAKAITPFYWGENYHSNPLRWVLSRDVQWISELPLAPVSGVRKGKHWKHLKWRGIRWVQVLWASWRDRRPVCQKKVPWVGSWQILSKRRGWLQELDGAIQSVWKGALHWWGPQKAGWKGNQGPQEKVPQQEACHYQLWNRHFEMGIKQRGFAKTLEPLEQKDQSWCHIWKNRS